MRGCASRPPPLPASSGHPDDRIKVDLDEDPVTSTLPPPVTDGDVLVRLPAPDAAWAATLPAAPGGHLLTLTLGHPSLLPEAGGAGLPTGYRLVGVASEQRPIGRTVDVYVPAMVRDDHPEWWRSVLERAERVFDLRLGPVQQVLAAELALHTRAPTDLHT